MKLVVEIAAADLTEVANAIAARVAELIAPAPAEVVTGHTASQFGIGRRRFLELTRTGQIPSFREGKKTCARRADVLAWLDKRRAATPERPPVAAEAAIDAMVRQALESGRLQIVKGGRK